MYEYITRYLDLLKGASRAGQLELCRQMAQDMRSAQCMDPTYMDTLTSYGIDEPWEADVSDLEVSGLLALLTFVHRAQVWRDSAYDDALDGGLLIDVLERLYEIDAPSRDLISPTAWEDFANMTFDEFSHIAGYHTRTFRRTCRDMLRGM